MTTPGSDLNVASAPHHAAPSAMQPRQTSPPAPTFLNIRIRFSHSDIPDIPLLLPLPTPGAATSPSDTIGEGRHDGNRSSGISIDNLKGLIRARLPEAWNAHGLKLIYGGRVLTGRDEVLAALRLDPSTLKVTPSRHVSREGTPDPNTASHREGDNAPLLVKTSRAQGESKGKGKEHALVADVLGVSDHGAMPPASSLTESIYVHCAITPSPLDAEVLSHQLSLEAEKLAPKTSNPKPTPPPSSGASSPPTHTPSNNASSTTTTSVQPQQQPQGFDRLLDPSSGFTPSDVSALRAQFRGIISTRYTPDTMPDAVVLRRMEEAWLEDSSSLPPPPPRPSASFTSAPGGGTSSGTLWSQTGGRRQGLAARLAGGITGRGSSGPALETAEQSATSTAGQTGDGGAGGYTDDDASASLDDTFYGVFMGFFWPLGACVWGLREEGVWSRRRGWAVLAGVMVNVGFGIVRVLS